MKTVIRLSLNANTNAAPDWMLLLPAGDITARDGRFFRNHTPQTIVDNFASERRDIPIDYEHATELRAPQGLPAPAVGWISELKVEAGEVFGKVSWTDEGRTAVESRSYRYISPVIHLDTATRMVIHISSVSLTNDPALYLKSLNRREAPEPNEDTLMFKAIAKALKLSETATEAEILSAIATEHAAKELLRNQVDKPDAAKYVLRTEHDQLIEACSALRGENKALKDAEMENTVVSLVDDAISSGKVIPAIRDSELELCRALGAEKYKERLSKLSAVLPVGETTTKATPEKEPGKLDDAQKEMCRNLGIKEEDYIKTLTA